METNKGITLLISLTVVSALLLISFVVTNIATKQLVLANGNMQSQYAFYNSESGLDCAIYWDLPRNGDPSPFDPYTPLPYTVTPRCNNQDITFINPSTFDTIPPVGIVSGYSTTTFQVNLTSGCVTVDVVKSVGSATTTKIESRGYNTCVSGAIRRFERGIKINY